MRVCYGKKRWVPDSCPKCGESRFVQLRPEEGQFKGLALGVAFGAIFKVVFGSWRLELGEYPGFRGLPAWWGACGHCTFEEALREPNPFIMQIPHDAFQGSTFLLPMGRR